VPTRAVWRRRILQELGDEGVDVELTEQQLDAAMDRALELWARHRPYLRWYPFDIPASETFIINFFAEPEQVDENKYPYSRVHTVLDVIFQDAERRILGPRAGFLEGFYLRWGYQGPRLFAQLHAGERTYERLAGTRPDWRWEPESRQLYISNPSRDTRIMVLGSRPRKLSEIEPGQESQFLAASLAKAKMMLARVLGSLGEIPGPAGPINTDAETLRSEGKEEWTQVVEKLEVALSSYPPPRFVG